MMSSLPTSVARAAAALACGPGTRLSAGPTSQHFSRMATTATCPLQQQQLRTHSSSSGYGRTAPQAMLLAATAPPARAFGRRNKSSVAAASGVTAADGGDPAAPRIDDIVIEDHRHVERMYDEYKRPGGHGCQAAAALQATTCNR